MPEPRRSYLRRAAGQVARTPATSHHVAPRWRMVPLDAVAVRRWRPVGGTGCPYARMRPGYRRADADALEFWTANNVARDGSTFVESEYLEVAGLRR